MNRFTKHIWKSIDRFDYSVWIVKKIPAIKCTCINSETKQPSLHCDRCLGTGNKIKIYKAKAATREGKDSEMLTAETRANAITPKIIYFKYGVLIDKDDYIIDKESIYRVYNKQYLRGEDGEPNTIKCTCPNHKMENKTILDNFIRILSKHGYTI